MPGGCRCSVAICKSHSTAAKASGLHLKFFGFPKDKKIKKQWIERCYRKDKWNPDNGKICSLHFTQDDYEDALKAELMNVTPKKLKSTAVPSQRLLPTKTELAKPKERPTKFSKKKNRTIFVEDIINKSLEAGESEKVEEISEVATIMDNEEKIRLLEEQVEHLKTENELINKNLMISKQKFNIELEKVNSLQGKIFSLQRCLEETKQAPNFDEQVKNAFKGTFTSNQVDIILKKKSKARWTQEELNTAFTLRYLSVRCYIFLRNKLKYPIPGLSTLRKWAGNLRLRDGVLEDVILMMDVAGKDKSALNRVTVLSFDEMKINSVYEYAVKEDEIVGPHSYMQVIMARGLFDNWKQPVFVGFDTKMTKDLLMHMISKLHGISFEVVACVSDCGGGNQGLWRELGVTIENTSIAHPITDERIYFFADVPHLLKLLRNWYIDKGFILEDGEINKLPVEALIRETRTEISSCHKVTQLHINCEKTQRQNVKLAAQLFSNSTAEALKRYLPGDDSQLASRTGNFFSLVNKWFDTLNSYSPTASVPTKRPYGLKLEDQRNTLNEMISVMSNLKCKENKKTLNIFQKGIIISSKSAQGLYEDMKRKYSVTYILCHRVNQDCLEKFFSQLRTRGGLHDHPSPLNAIDRLRMILLGKNPGIVQKKINVLQAEDQEQQGDEYLMARVIAKSRLKIVGPESLPEDEECLLFSDTESSSSSGSEPSLSGINKGEQDGLLYLAGYLAFKHKDEFAYLGNPTYQRLPNFHDYSIPASWIQSLSHGGLMQPSDKWAQETKTMEHYFLKLHNEEFKQKKQVLNITVNYVSSKMKCKEIDHKLIVSFCKLRIYLRIKHLNAMKAELKTKKSFSVS